MKIKHYFFSAIILGLIFIAGCKNADLSKDVEGIADVHCRNIDVMTKLRSANPEDSAMINKLQVDAKKLQIEMTILYKEFKEKYKEKVKDNTFNKEFSRLLRKSMLKNCTSLSKEDREQFEKEVEK
ncbi:MAG: hypothetical protein NTX61_01000 [Bacteroidetes bacterium]|nr:hypothetical protein [Bacteroidota bacterium]